jgi:hypothetical protein
LTILKNGGRLTRMIVTPWDEPLLSASLMTDARLLEVFAAGEIKDWEIWSVREAPLRGHQASKLSTILGALVDAPSGRAGEPIGRGAR